MIWHGWMAAAVSLVALAGCGRKDRAQIPLGMETASDSALTLVWQGSSQAYRVDAAGGWVRDPTYDYAFTVVQRRDGAHWRSVKTLQRLHPAYDGRGGDRAQTLFFSLDYRRAGDSLELRAESTLGSGTGRSDREFREQRLEMPAAEAGRFTPYDLYRITQHYRYEEGVLLETVELNKRVDGKEKPFMRMEEKAWIYARNLLPGAPSRM